MFVCETVWTLIFESLGPWKGDSTPVQESSAWYQSALCVCVCVSVTDSVTVILTSGNDPKTIFVPEWGVQLPWKYDVKTIEDNFPLFF